MAGGINLGGAYVSLGIDMTNLSKGISAALDSLKKLEDYGKKLKIEGPDPKGLKAATAEWTKLTETVKATTTTILNLQKSFATAVSAITSHERQAIATTESFYNAVTKLETQSGKLRSALSLGQEPSRFRNEFASMKTAASKSLDSILADVNKIKTSLTDKIDLKKFLALPASLPLLDRFDSLYKTINKSSTEMKKLEAEMSKAGGYTAGQLETWRKLEAQITASEIKLKGITAEILRGANALKTSVLPNVKYGGKDFASPVKALTTAANDAKDAVVRMNNALKQSSTKVTTPISSDDMVQVNTVLTRVLATIEDIGTKASQINIPALMRIPQVKSQIEAMNKFVSSSTNSILNKYTQLTKTVTDLKNAEKAVSDAIREKRKAGESYIEVQILGEQKLAGLKEIAKRQTIELINLMTKMPEKYASTASLDPTKFVPSSTEIEGLINRPLQQVANTLSGLQVQYQQLKASSKFLTPQDRALAEAMGNEIQSMSSALRLLQNEFARTKGSTEGFTKGFVGLELASQVAHMQKQASDISQASQQIYKALDFAPIAKALGFEQITSSLKNMVMEFKKNTTTLEGTWAGVQSAIQLGRNKIQEAFDSFRNFSMEMPMPKTGQAGLEIYVQLSERMRILNREVSNTKRNWKLYNRELQTMLQLSPQQWANQQINAMKLEMTTLDQTSARWNELHDAIMKMSDPTTMEQSFSRRKAQLEELTAVTQREAQRQFKAFRYELVKLEHDYTNTVFRMARSITKAMQYEPVQTGQKFSGGFQSGEMIKNAKAVTELKRTLENLHAEERLGINVQQSYEGQLNTMSQIIQRGVPLVSGMVTEMTRLALAGENVKARYDSVTTVLNTFAQIAGKKYMLGSDFNQASEQIKILKAETEKVFVTLSELGLTSDRTALKIKSAFDLMEAHALGAGKQFDQARQIVSNLGLAMQKIDQGGKFGEKDFRSMTAQIDKLSDSQKALLGPIELWKGMTVKSLAAVQARFIELISNGLEPARARILAIYEETERDLKIDEQAEAATNKLKALDKTLKDVTASQQAGTVSIEQMREKYEALQQLQGLGKISPAQAVEMQQLAAALDTVTPKMERLTDLQRRLIEASAIPAGAGQGYEAISKRLDVLKGSAENLIKSLAVMEGVIQGQVSSEQKYAQVLEKREAQTVAFNRVLDVFKELRASLAKTGPIDVVKDNEPEVFERLIQKAKSLDGVLDALQLPRLDLEATKGIESFDELEKRVQQKMERIRKAMQGELGRFDFKIQTEGLDAKAEENLGKLKNEMALLTEEQMKNINVTDNQNKRIDNLHKAYNYALNPLGVFTQYVGDEIRITEKNIAAMKEQGAVRGLSVTEINKLVTAEERLNSLRRLSKGVERAKYLEEEIAKIRGMGAAGIQQYSAELRRYEQELSKVSKTLKTFSDGETGRIDTVTGRYRGLRKIVGSFIDDVTNLIQVQIRWYATQQLLFNTARQLKEAFTFYIDLEVQVRRVASAVADQGNIGQRVVEIQKAITDEMRRTGKAAEELATITWELISAGLTQHEAMSGLTHVVNLAAGSELELSEATRITAGLFRIFGDEVAVAGSASDKFRYIVDRLAATLNQSQVDMNGLISGLGYLINEADAVGLKFEQVLGILSVLNNRMLMGSKAGRAASRVLTQLTANADKLSEAFNIEIDMTKPLDLVDVLEQLNVRLKESMVNGELTAETFSKLQDIFGQVGKRAAVGLILNIDELKKSIDDLKLGKFDDLAEKMARIRLDTLKTDMDRLAVSFRSFLSEALQPVIAGFQQLTRFGIDSVDKLNAVRESGEGFGNEIIKLGATFALFKGLQIILSKVKDKAAPIGSLFGVIGRAATHLVWVVRNLGFVLTYLGVGVVDKVRRGFNLLAAAMGSATAAAKLGGAEAAAYGLRMGLIGAAITIVLTGLYLWYKQSKKQEEVLANSVKKLEDVNNAYSESLSTLNTYTEGLATLVDKYKEAIPYTEEWTTLREQLGETYTGILVGLDREIALTDSGTETTKRYVEMKERELAVVANLEKVHSAELETYDALAAKLEQLEKVKNPLGFLSRSTTENVYFDTGVFQKQEKFLKSIADNWEDIIKAIKLSIQLGKDLPEPIQRLLVEYKSLYVSSSAYIKLGTALDQMHREIKEKGETSLNKLGDAYSLLPKKVQGVIDAAGGVKAGVKLKDEDLLSIEKQLKEMGQVEFNLDTSRLIPELDEIVYSIDSYEGKLDLLSPTSEKGSEKTLAIFRELQDIMQTAPQGVKNLSALFGFDMEEEARKYEAAYQEITNSALNEKEKMLAIWKLTKKANHDVHEVLLKDSRAYATQIGVTIRDIIRNTTISDNESVQQSVAAIRRSTEGIHERHKKALIEMSGENEEIMNKIINTSEKLGTEAGPALAKLYSDEGFIKALNAAQPYIDALQQMSDIANDTSMQFDALFTTITKMAEVGLRTSAKFVNENINLIYEATALMPEHMRRVILSASNVEKVAIVREIKKTQAEIRKQVQETGVLLTDPEKEAIALELYSKMYDDLELKAKEYYENEQKLTADLITNIKGTLSGISVVGGFSSDLIPEMAMYRDTVTSLVEEYEKLSKAGSSLHVVHLQMDEVDNELFDTVRRGVEVGKSYKQITDELLAAKRKELEVNESIVVNLVSQMELKEKLTEIDKKYAEQLRKAKTDVQALDFLIMGEEEYKALVSAEKKVGDLQSRIERLGEAYKRTDKDIETTKKVLASFGDTFTQFDITALFDVDRGGLDFERLQEIAKTTGRLFDIKFQEFLNTLGQDNRNFVDELQNLVVEKTSLADEEVDEFVADLLIRLKKTGAKTMKEAFDAIIKRFTDGNELLKGQINDLKGLLEGAQKIFADADNQRRQKMALASFGAETSGIEMAGGGGEIQALTDTMIQNSLEDFNRITQESNATLEEQVNLLLVNVRQDSAETIRRVLDFLVGTERMTRDEANRFFIDTVGGLKEEYKDELVDYMAVSQTMRKLDIRGHIQYVQTKEGQYDVEKQKAIEQAQAILEVEKEKLEQLGKMYDNAIKLRQDYLKTLSSTLTAEDFTKTFNQLADDEEKSLTNRNNMAKKELDYYNALLKQHNTKIRQVNDALRAYKENAHTADTEEERQRNEDLENELKARVALEEKKKEAIKQTIDTLTQQQGDSALTGTLETINAFGARAADIANKTSSDIETLGQTLRAKLESIAAEGNYEFSGLYSSLEELKKKTGIKADEAMGSLEKRFRERMKTLNVPENEVEKYVDLLKLSFAENMKNMGDQLATIVGEQLINAINVKEFKDIINQRIESVFRGVDYTQFELLGYIPEQNLQAYTKSLDVLEKMFKIQRKEGIPTLEKQLDLQYEILKAQTEELKKAQEKVDPTGDLLKQKKLIIDVNNARKNQADTIELIKKLSGDLNDLIFIEKDTVGKQVQESLSLASSLISAFQAKVELDVEKNQIKLDQLISVDDTSGLFNSLATAMDGVYYGVVASAEKIRKAYLDSISNIGLSDDTYKKLADSFNRELDKAINAAIPESKQKMIDYMNEISPVDALSNFLSFKGSARITMDFLGLDTSVLDTMEQQIKDTAGRSLPEMKNVLAGINDKYVNIVGEVKSWGVLQKAANALLAASGTDAKSLVDDFIDVAIQSGLSEEHVALLYNSLSNGASKAEALKNALGQQFVSEVAPAMAVIGEGAEYAEILYDTLNMEDVGLSKVVEDLVRNLNVSSDKADNLLKILDSGDLDAFQSALTTSGISQEDVARVLKIVNKTAEYRRLLGGAKDIQEIIRRINDEVALKLKERLKYENLSVEQLKLYRDELKKISFLTGTSGEIWAAMKLGAADAWEAFRDEATNAYSIVNSLMTDMFTGLSGALSDTVKYALFGDPENDEAIVGQQESVMDLEQQLAENQRKQALIQVGGVRTDEVSTLEGLIADAAELREELRKANEELADMQDGSKKVEEIFDKFLQSLLDKTIDKAIEGLFATVFDKLMDMADDLFDFLWDGLKQLGESLLDTFSTIFKGIGGLFGGGGGGMLNFGAVGPIVAKGGVFHGFSETQDANQTSLATLLKGLTTRFFASGGVATSPTLGVFGEGSNYEAFVPLPDNKSIPVTITNNGTDDRENKPIQIVNVTDPESLIGILSENPDVIINIISSDIRQRGMVFNDIQNVTKNK